MTSRDKLLELVESLPEKQADELLRLAMALKNALLSAGAGGRTPFWHGLSR